MSDDRIEAIARDLWQDVLDKDDRNSPAEYPDMALLTFDEFRANIIAALESELAALRAANGVMREALEYILGSQSYEGDLLGHDMARAALNR